MSLTAFNAARRRKAVKAAKEAQEAAKPDEPKADAEKKPAKSGGKKK